MFQWKKYVFKIDSKLCIKYCIIKVLLFFSKHLLNFSEIGTCCRFFF